ncbi:peptide/nickel transport system permease protein [Bradyrhizobium sp. NFR13]|jgi:peptide/nickel transport system permease protein|uniref:ABC transporter permease n=1 Tax=Bradyrhizobium sp. NFR13 TaxID=1566285 RepID=UPI0008E3C7F9|nr:ABC transporter permease [Bradyrhizobium sp. NFR13]SFM09082.1 peptide/nickel transport system permease protein [Bradyrhizobium sp. NFR13]
MTSASINSGGRVFAVALALAGWFVKFVAVVLVIATFNFILVHAAPGDPAQVIAGQSGASDEKLLAQLRAEYGLDKPYPIQLANYLKRVVTLDLGYSYRQQRTVASLILERLPATLLLTATAFTLALLSGIILGTLAGVRAGKWSDTLLTIVSLLLYATPVFWLGLMLVLLFSVQLDWLPAFGYVTIGVPMTTLQRMGDIGMHLILPAVSLAAVYLAIYTRLMRSSVLDVTHQDFIKTAKAKGLKQGRIIIRHILRNAMLPIVTVAGMQAGALVGGAVVIETVFAWPGLGRLIYDALLQRDYPVLLGVFLVMSVIVIALNLLTDTIYRVIDPRVSVRAAS